MCMSLQSMDYCIDVGAWELVDGSRTCPIEEMQVRTSRLQLKIHPCLPCTGLGRHVRRPYVFQRV